MIFKQLTKTFAFIWSHPLNRHHRMRGVARFVHWQTAMRLTNSPMVYPWINGVQALISIGESGFTKNVYCGLHEYVEMLFLLHSLRPSDLFVDVGANVGAYTLLAGGVVQARVIAIEPVPSTFRRLENNVFLNRLADRVQLVQCGVGARAAIAEFSTSLNCMNHVLGEVTSASVDSVALPIRTLDDLLDGTSPFAIKIDVEGYEAAVLEGAQSTLRSEALQVIIMELNGSSRRYGIDESTILTEMAKFDFTPATYEPFYRKIIPLSGKCRTSENTLFIRGSDGLRDRIRTAAAVRINQLEI